MLRTFHCIGCCQQHLGMKDRKTEEPRATMRPGEGTAMAISDTFDRYQNPNDAVSAE